VDNKEKLMLRLRAFQRIEAVVSEFACTRNARIQYEQDLMFLATELGLRQEAPTTDPVNAESNSKYIPKKNKPVESVKKQ
jgi:hypothetical protein